MSRLRTAAPPALPEPESADRQPGRRRTLLIWAAVAVVAILVASQLLLPAIATRELRHRVAGDGTVLSAQVHAFPAIKLLWRHADSVELSMSNYDVNLDKVTGLLDESLDADRVDVDVATLKTNLLSLREVSFRKRGSQLVGQAEVSTAALQQAFPVIKSIEPVGAADGRLTFRGTADLLGAKASVTAVLEASDGKLVLAPSGLLSSLARVTLFDDPQIKVRSVSGHATSDGMVVTLTGEAV